MNVTEPKAKRLDPQTPSTTAAKSEKPAAKDKPANALIDSVKTTTPPSDSEKANVTAFYKQAMQSALPKQPLSGPLPNVPMKTSTKPVDIRGALPPNPANAKALYESAKAPSPNATIGPIAHEQPFGDGAAIAEKECKMGAELVGELPIVGKPLKNEIEEACKKPEPSAANPLPNVPKTAAKGTALGTPETK